jgi:signal transduction histidine kinase
MSGIVARETPEGWPSEILRSVATLAAAASHEINNPLMVIVANLELLERTQTLDAYGRVRLGAALAAAGQIKDKIRRLGRITQLELAAGGPTLPPMLDLEKSSRVREAHAAANATAGDATQPGH